MSDQDSSGCFGRLHRAFLSAAPYIHRGALERKSSIRELPIGTGCRCVFFRESGTLRTLRKALASEGVGRLDCEITSVGGQAPFTHRLFLFLHFLRLLNLYCLDARFSSLSFCYFREYWVLQGVNVSSVAV